MAASDLGRILVVDDETELLAVLTEKLAQQGYEVVGCSNPRDALNTIKGQTFDVLLTDMMMPEMDGIDLLRAALQLDPNLAAVLMTGQATVETAVKALKQGALDYVLKPFKTPALLPVLARAMEVRRLRLDNVQLRETVAIHDLCRAISFTTDLNTILNKIIDAAVEQCEAEEASVMLASPDGKELCVRAVRGGADRGTILGERVPIDQGVAGWVARSREPLTLQGEVRDTRFTPLRPRPDIHSSISTPMLVGGKLVGIINVNSTRRHRPFTLGQAKGLGILASAGAAAIEGATLLAQLRESEARYRSIFDNAVEGIFQSTRQGGFLTVNPALARIAGYESPAQMVASITNIREQFFVDSDRFDELQRTLDEEGLVTLFEFQAYRKDGVTFLAVQHTRAVEDVAGKLLYYEGALEDITEHRRLEEQYRQAQKMEAIGQLAGGVAHDFNNLLTIVNGYSELLFDRLASDEASRELIAEIKKAGERAAGLTRQLLAFSRKQVLLPVVLDLNNLIHELVRMLRRLIGEHIELRFLPGPELDRVKIDPGQLEQVLMNLLVNARDAMPSGGRLTIETRNVELDRADMQPDMQAEPGKYVLLTVSDTGHGMDAETKARLFEPFFTTKERGKGTGLGLATVFGIVRQSRGHIAVESEVGRGASFKIYLPSAQVGPQPHAVSAPPIKIPMGTETVLLVEDESGVRALAALILRSSGYTVLEAKDGEEALRIARQHSGKIHLLVTDVIMPKMSGPQLAEELAKVRAGMKTLFVSGYTGDAILRQDALEGRGSFLQKPFTGQALAMKVREALENEPATG